MSLCLSVSLSRCLSVSLSLRLFRSLLLSISLTHYYYYTQAYNLSELLNWRAHYGIKEFIENLKNKVRLDQLQNIRFDLGFQSGMRIRNFFPRIRIRIRLS